MKEDFVKHIREIIKITAATISKPFLTDETGGVNVKGDRSIGMDIKMEEVIVEYIKSKNLPVNIFSEEQGIISFHSKPTHLLVFDPLDGSINYKIGKTLLPYGLLLAFYDGLKPKLKNILASGAVEYTRELIWLYDGEKTVDGNDKIVRLKDNWRIDRSTPIYLDLYYSQGYESYRRLANFLSIRNVGATVGNLSNVLANTAAGMGGVCMRPEEVGAVYSLIKGAKGIAIDDFGVDLGERDFDPQGVYPILAGNSDAIKFCVAKINEK